MGRLIHRTGPACTYFVTTKTWENRALFKVSEVAEIIVNCIVECRADGAYLLHDFVVMPDHVHALLTPGDTTTLERALQLIKGGSSFNIHHARGHSMQIWLPGFHDWTIRDSADYEARRDYIRMNPVRAGLAERPENWLYGSACGRFSMDAMPTRLQHSFRG